MGARAVISPAAVAVAPGSVATVEVQVHNTGTVVDGLTLEVVGEPAAWARVEPPTLNLFPGTDGSATITFTPPAGGAVPAGRLAFAVRVTSREDAAGSVTEEGHLDVQPYVSVGVDIAPRTSRGRRAMSHEIAVDNHSNTPLTVGLAALDPDQRLAFSVEPATLAVDAASAAFAQLRVRPTKRHPSGPPLTHPFQVVASGPDGQHLATAHGMAVQDPVRPPWLARAAVMALLAVLALAGLWYAVLKPTVESAAREAVEEDAQPAAITPGGASGETAGGGGGGGGGDVSGKVEGASASTATPIDGRLFVTSPGPADFTVGEGQTLQLTDIVLQNPNGNTGTLRIQRDGTPLLVVELANFRDLDYHFVSPIVFTSGQKLVLVAECTSPTCTPGAYFSGYVTR